LIKVRAKGRKFNAGYYIAEILEPLSQWRSTEAADNARPHIAKLSAQYFTENRMKSAPHLPCSPDLVPLNFYLFGHVKRCLAGLLFQGADQLLTTVEGILADIEKVTLQAVFLEWMDRLRKCIATNGEYPE
jgi:hypothetical protein